MLSLDDFQPIALEAKGLFDAHHAEYPPNHSENVFSTLVSWNHFVQSSYAKIGENLIIMTRVDDKVRFRPPSGPKDRRLLEQVVELAEDLGSDILLALIDNEQREWMARQYPDMIFTKHRDYFDYVYLAKDLAELGGKPYLKLRSKLNKFKRLYEYETENLCEQNINEIREFLKRWCLWKDCESDPLLDNERTAIMYTIEHCFELGLCGLALRIGDEIEAVSVFDSMSPDMTVVYFEKAMPDFDGIYQAINNETAKLLAQERTYINRQSDLGIPGLRTAKERYHPHHMIEVQHMTRYPIESPDVKGPKGETDIY